METKTHNPSFTVSLRGYDRDEVDHYLDSLSEALAQVEDAEEHNRRLQTHVNRLNARIKDLEDRIRADEPRTGLVVGERISILLREAEDAATETITRAEAKAVGIEAEAQAKADSADETVRSAVSRGEDQARRIEAAAKAEAAEVIAEAEARANARTQQIEQWAEQVISHTRAEEARMLRDLQEKRKTVVGELKELADQRGAAARCLSDLRYELGKALGIIEVSASDSPEPAAASFAEPVADDADVSVAANEIDLTEIEEENDKSSIVPDEAEPMDLWGDADCNGASGDAQFEAKLEAWVSGGSNDDGNG
jgi:DivIVA domain-containing protein